MSENNMSVALELMTLIGQQESSARSNEADQKTREYWFRLYLQCLNAVEGASLSEVLKAAD